MNSAQERQQLEITALRSIYEGDFFDRPPPKAWKGAMHLPEFSIHVVHPTRDKISFYLNVKLPKTYPTLACPIFAIEKPIEGLNNEQVATLMHNITAESQKSRGSEQVFQIVDYCQDWMEQNVKPKAEVVGSLALQMNQRTVDEEKARQQRFAADAERAQKLAEEREALFQEEAIRQLLAREQQYKARKRANSEATEIPLSEWAVDLGPGGGTDTMTETFDRDVEVNVNSVGKVKFRTVRLFQPKKDRFGLGTIYLADPVCDDVNMTLPLELYVVDFYSSYYGTAQGRKKLQQVESEILSLATVRHANVTAVFTAKLVFFPYPSSSPGSAASSFGANGKTMVRPSWASTPRAQLMVLSEQTPALALYDVLSDVEGLREDKVLNYLAQILTGLNAVHERGLEHRGISADEIFLAPSPTQAWSKVVKLGKPAFPTRLLDLHRSNPFGDDVPLVPEAFVPDAWLSQDVKNESMLVYTRQRDIHAVGIVLLQMVLGLDVREKYSDINVALESLQMSPLLARHALNMINPSKKAHASCLAFLADLTQTSTSPALSSQLQRSQSLRALSPRLSSQTPAIATAAVSTWRVKTPGPLDPLVNTDPSSPEDGGMFFQNFELRMPPPPRQQRVSRWKEDWEELELLGKGAFGSVVKARNKIDNHIYAVKKIRLKTAGNDEKIFREVLTLSRLTHRFIVRYYTTWIEVSDEPLPTPASDSESTSGTTDGSGVGEAITSVPNSARRYGHGQGGFFTMGNGSTSSESDPRSDESDSSTSSERHLPTVGGDLTIDFSDARSVSSRSSFPSIHFGGGSASSSPGILDGSSSGESEDDFEVVADLRDNLWMPGAGSLTTPKAARRLPRTLYIQMEFVERQTLKERIDEGIREDEAWALFHQIVEALVYMSSVSILHRDIKLTNIFIDANGDCKIGDFGLATTSLATVDPSSLSPNQVPAEADMTFEVGTRLYIAPEVLSRKRGLRNHNKADMYSLGIVFFEMNYRFSTGSERIAVLEDLRKPGIFFPPGWDPGRTRQRDIITWLLQHRPEDRPTAVELSRSPLIPQRVEDEYLKGALELMIKDDSPQQRAILSSLFSQPPRRSRGFLYDLEADLPEHAALNGIVQERLAAIFRLHGAVDIEPPLIMPVLNENDTSHKAAFLDKNGDLVTLPDDLITPFARLAARGSIKRIKRYHVGDVYRPEAVAGHPKAQKVAIFDIITPDLSHGPIASGAELIAVANDCLNSFPNLSQNYEIHVSHSKIIDLVLTRLPVGHRAAVVEIMSQTKSSLSQKRALLLKRGLLRSVADELEVLAEIDEDIDGLIYRLEKLSSSLTHLIQASVNELKQTLDFAKATKVTRPLYFHPLMVGIQDERFKDGILIQVVRKNKRSDIFAIGGRYDNLIAQHVPLKSQMEHVCALGLQITVEKITVALASFQSSSVKAFVKEERSFGYWSPRRCDVYVVSYHPGHLQERLEVVSYLWQNNISADFMYESGLSDAGHEDHIDMCVREGILFTLHPRPRSGRRDQAAFRIKSILKGSETDVNRQELISWLQHEIAEQKKIDLATSGAITASPGVPYGPAGKDVPTEVHLVLPSDTKKQRKQVKQIFSDRAYETTVQLKSSIQAGLPTVAVDLPPAVFDNLSRNSHWISEEEAWKAVLSTFPTPMTAYAQQIRECAAKRKADGHRFMLLCAVREDRVQLITL